MTEWSIESDWPMDHPYDLSRYDAGGTFYPEKPPPVQRFLPPAPAYEPTHAQLCGPQPPSPSLKLLLSTPNQFGRSCASVRMEHTCAQKVPSPREIRNKAEKQRRDKLSHSILALAGMVPPVQATKRKVDKTGVLRLAAHFLRAHQHVFGDSIGQSSQELSPSSSQTLLTVLKGFLITTTYKGVIVVASQNVQQYLGYSELDLLGQKISSIVHPQDHELLMEQLMPPSRFLGPNGELQIPDGPGGNNIVAEALANEKRKFTIRFKKLSPRSDPAQYLTCVVEGNLRKSDRAIQGASSRRSFARRARARSSCESSGNDIVFIGMVRPVTETFMAESNLEAYCLEYKTRHSIDGEIIQVDHRISLVTGYMAHEVSGVNAMNFMHRDDVRWVISALRGMYDHNSLFGESCYRLMTKNGQFIYMRTHGMLDVDENTRAVRSFVCTNTQVEEEEGMELISKMKQRLMMIIENSGGLHQNCNIPASPVTVEDPKQLEKVILDLVTNLPSPQAVERHLSPERGEFSGEPQLPLAIIPPQRERIVSAIERIYSVIKVFHGDPVSDMEEDQFKTPQSLTLRNPTEAIKTKPMDAQTKRMGFALQGIDRLPASMQKQLLKSSDDEEDVSSVSLLNHGRSTDGYVTDVDSSSSDYYTLTLPSPRKSNNNQDFILFSPDDEPQAGTSAMYVDPNLFTTLNDESNSEQDGIRKHKKNGGSEKQQVPTDEEIGLHIKDFIKFSFEQEDDLLQPGTSAMYSGNEGCTDPWPTDGQSLLNFLDVSETTHSSTHGGNDNIEIVEEGETSQLPDLQEMLMDVMDDKQDFNKN